jgi:hypothetical protein
MQTWRRRRRASPAVQVLRRPRRASPVVQAQERRCRHDGGVSELTGGRRGDGAGELTGASPSIHNLPL